MFENSDYMHTLVKDFVVILHVSLILCQEK